jgi:hypothetical protein
LLPQCSRPFALSCYARREIAAASSTTSQTESGFSHLVRKPLMNFEQDISVLVRIDNYKCARATIKAGLCKINGTKCQTAQPLGMWLIFESFSTFGATYAWYLFCNNVDLHCMV